MQKLALIHPRMLTTLTPTFYPDLANFEYLPDTTALNSIHDASAQADWTPFLSAIPCYIAAVIVPKRGDEQRTDKTTVVSKNLFLQLNGYYPTITEKMRAKVARQHGTVLYDILSVNHDSQRKTSKLEVQVII